MDITLFEIFYRVLLLYMTTGLRSMEMSGGKYTIQTGENDGQFLQGVT